MGLLSFPVRFILRRPAPCPRVYTDGVRSLARSYGDVITKFSRLDGSARAPWARRSSAKSSIILSAIHTHDVRTMFASRKHESEAVIQVAILTCEGYSLRKNNIGTLRVFHSQNELPIVSFHRQLIVQTFLSFILVLVESKLIAFHAASCWHTVYLAL